MPSTLRDLQALSARLDKLERQSRRWKVASVVLALSSASLILMAAKPADHVDSTVIHARTVVAQDFVVKDEDGQVRARLTLNPNKKDTRGIALSPPPGPALQFYDDNGNAFWTAPQSPTVIPAR
jgi:hypothetical protein